MSTKENNLKEKFKIALTSTAKVIADDFDVKKTNSEEKKIKEFNFLEIDNLTSPADFIRLRAETDSSALKKKFCNETIYKKNLPSNTSSRSLYNIAKKIRYKTLGEKMHKGNKKNLNISILIHLFILKVVYKRVNTLTKKSQKSKPPESF